MDTATRIREQMQAAGISVNALADATAIPRMTLTRRLARPDTFTLTEIERVATALNVRVSWILGIDAA